MQYATCNILKSELLNYRMLTLIFLYGGKGITIKGLKRLTRELSKPEDFLQAWKRCGGLRDHLGCPMSYVL